VYQESKCKTALEARNFEDSAAIKKEFTNTPRVEGSDTDKHLNITSQTNGVFPDYFTNEEASCPATTCRLMKIGCIEEFEEIEYEDDSDRDETNIFATSSEFKDAIIRLTGNTFVVD